MNNHVGRFQTILALFLSVVLLLAACGGNAATDQTAAEPDAPATDEEAAAASGETVRQSFGGGPVGGAFQTFANALSLIITDADPNLDIAAEGTGGSAANLRGVNAADFQYGIVYAADMSLGREGLLPEDETVYDQLRTVAKLYGGVIHLVVSEQSGIESVDDLPGKRIALGNAGSGAALSAERYFRHLGLYDQMEIEFLGYSQAAAAMGDGQLDGFWILAAFPNASVTEASTLTSIRLIDVYNPGVEAGFFDEFPFYTERALLGGAYTGVDEDVPSFQDTAIWSVNADVPEELVYNAVKAVFEENGLASMVQAHPAASEMSPAEGAQNIPIPLHPGAQRYWEEIGTEIPDAALPQE
ncbi:MAG: hypothetical protein GFH27_549283n14 [Chloroflexi bacterium AL-W]|nr:hypothetical protein [Chloroflexi bacterium AL-N1]NOK64866.1 hypothetical protein [Chloroflexi bacterium AL-N10]NOK76636.1 hypothetical protein [Chloroflexi bacterium AL-N5]NOK80135.1 hypothetical protein [Chloroflexi bacterium AL-W]NOK86648.1 hypothetical protein [Chloroflexi bacterium AL-N15]